MGEVVAYTQVNFAEAGDGSSIRLELDSIANGGKTTFDQGTECHLIVFTEPDNMPIQAVSTLGYVKNYFMDWKFVEVTDRIVVKPYRTAPITKQLDYQPKSAISIKTITGTLWNNSYRIEGRNITFDTNVSGIFEFTYSIIGQCLHLSNVAVPYGSETAEVLITVASTGFYEAEPAEITVTYKTAEAKGTPETVTIEIINFLTGEPVDGAFVSVSGPDGFSYEGISDGKGQLYIGECQPGSYEAIVTKTGMTQGAADRSFTV